MPDLPGINHQNRTFSVNANAGHEIQLAQATTILKTGKVAHDISENWQPC